MPFSYEDKCAIKLLKQQKGYSSRKFIKEFPSKQWTKGGLDKLLKKIDSTGSVKCTPGSAHPRIVRADDKIHLVKALVLNQENAPQNSQNDRVYGLRGSRELDIAPERLLRTRSTYSQSLMVSVGVSKLGRTGIHFVEPGVKINGDYYRNILLAQKLLLDIKELSEYFVFQQDGAPAHRARQTVELLQSCTPDFIPPTL